MKTDINTNEAYDLVILIQEAMLSEHNPCPTDGEQTKVVVEHPDGSYEPMTFAWYDKENNIIRICYEGDQDE